MSSPISATAPAWTRWSTGSAATCSSTEPGPAAGRVGRDGLLHLAFERRGDATVLTERRFRLPLQALETMDLEGTGVAAALMLLNPTGGIVGGDVLETRVALGAGSHACLTTPAASRVYRTAGPPAVQRFSALLGEGAVIEYLPDHLIPSPGARLHQSTELVLGAGARAIVSDAWAVGRVARGERWRFAELDLGITARDARGLLFKDRVIVTGHPGWDRLGSAEGMAYVASFLVLAPARESWEDLIGETRRALGQAPGVRGGVTELARGGLFARVLAPTAPDLGQCLEILWSLSRRAVLGLGPVGLRKL